MKQFSVMGWVVGCSFIALFLFFLGSEASSMTRGKKKLNYSELEEHVSDWALDKIEKLRCAVDEINDDSNIKEAERLLLFSGIADGFQELLDLLKKINHNEKHVIDWVQNFVGRYTITDDLEN